nr:hypothetical protein [Paraburkholderia sp. BL8N3]
MKGDVSFFGHQGFAHENGCQGQLRLSDQVSTTKAHSMEGFCWPTASRYDKQQVGGALKIVPRIMIGAKHADGEAIDGNAPRDPRAVLRHGDRRALASDAKIVHA